MTFSDGSINYWNRLRSTSPRSTPSMMEVPEESHQNVEGRSGSGQEFFGDKKRKARRGKLELLEELHARRVRDKEAGEFLLSAEGK